MRVSATGLRRVRGPHQKAGDAADRCCLRRHREVHPQSQGMLHKEVHDRPAGCEILLAASRSPALARPEPRHMKGSAMGIGNEQSPSVACPLQITPAGCGTRETSFAADREAPELVILV